MMSDRELQILQARHKRIKWRIIAASLKLSITRCRQLHVRAKKLNRDPYYMT